MLIQGRAIGCDAGPTLTKRWVNRMSTGVWQRQTHCQQIEYVT